MTKKRVSKAHPSKTKGMTQAEFGKHIDVSQPRVAQMIASGTISAMANGKIDPEVARVQYIRAIRRSPASEETRRVAAARARHIEIQNQKQLGKLVDIEGVQACVAEIINAFSAELAAVAAASTRDLALREVIQANLNGAIHRCKERLDRMVADAGAGRPLDQDQTEAGDED